MSSAPCQCQECGVAFNRPQIDRLFCSPSCRMEFNNRRAKRGAEIYDLFRALRRERSEAKRLNMWTLLCRLAEEWRDEDKRIRKGLQSWKDPRTIIEERVDLIGKRGRI